MPGPGHLQARGGRGVGLAFLARQIKPAPEEATQPPPATTCTPKGNKVAAGRAGGSMTTATVIQERERR
jgi:hypothetical protein